MDILGLVLIVIIVVMGLFFLMIASRTTNETKVDLLDSQLSQSLVNVMLQATTDCGQSFIKIVEDCYGRNNICGSVNSCDYISTKSKEILDGTLKKWKKPYRFYISKNNVKKVDIDSDELECTNLMKRSTGLLLIQDKEKVIIATLEICKI